MDDRSIVKRLLELGADVRRNDPDSYANAYDDVELRALGNAPVAKFLEELAGHRLVGDVLPCFTPTGAGFTYQVTDDALQLSLDPQEFEARLDAIVPPVPKYDGFISYAVDDAELAEEFHRALEDRGVNCFMAEKDIKVSEEWQSSIRKALIGSKWLMVLLTPRSHNRPWVLMEVGAAWALGKPLISATSHISMQELHDPISQYHARSIETIKQRNRLIEELVEL